MPIKGLTALTRSTEVEVTRLGKVFKGEPKQPKRAGADLKEKFRVELAGEYQALFRSAYGSMQPKQLRVFFPYHSTDENFQTWNDAMTVQGLSKRCDGERIIREVITQRSYKNGKPYEKRSAIDVDKPCSKQPGEAICQDCAATGYLTFLVRELVPYAGASKAMVLTATGINDVIHVTEQLRILEAKYGSLKETRLPVPEFGNRIPFVMWRPEVEISRPIYDAQKRAYTGGYTRGSAWPIQIAEDPKWLAHWTEIQRRAMIGQMLQAGQGHLLMDADRELAQQMTALEFPAMPSAKTLPEIAAAPALSLSPSQDSEGLFQDEPAIDTFAMADEDAIADGQAYRDELLARDPKVRIGKVNEVLGLPVEVLKDLRSQVSGESPQQTATEMIGAMIYAWGADNQRPTKIVSGVLESLRRDYPNLVDEDLAAAAIAELNLQSPMPTTPTPAATVDGVSIE